MHMQGRKNKPPTYPAEEAIRVTGEPKEVITGTGTGTTQHILGDGLNHGWHP